MRNMPLPVDGVFVSFFCTYQADRSPTGVLFVRVATPSILMAVSVQHRSCLLGSYHFSRILPCHAELIVICRASVWRRDAILDESPQMYQDTQVVFAPHSMMGNLRHMGESGVNLRLFW
jgi:hypothetical protein